MLPWELGQHHDPQLCWIVGGIVVKQMEMRRIVVNWIIETKVKASITHANPEEGGNLVKYEM